MTQYFSPFVLPFVIGTFILFTVCIIKYVRWWKHFTRRQRNDLLKNIVSFKFFSAIGETFNECLFHRKVTKRNVVLGYMHRSIALGWFLLIVMGAVEAACGVPGRRPIWVAIFYRYFVHSSAAGHTEAVIFANIMDTLLLYVLSGVTLAFVKSIYSRVVGMKKTTKHAPFDLFAKYSLWFIFPLRLLSESLTASVWNNGGWLTQGIGNMIDPEFAGMLELTSWTLYSTALGVFFVCMPFSRYMHIFTEVPLIFFRRLGVTEGAKKSGYTMYELSACSRCGICIDDCPLNSELGKKDVQSVYFLRDIRYKRPKLQTAEDCLMCGRCQQACPVGLDLMSIRRQMRDRGAMDGVGNYSYLNKVQTFNAIGRVGYFGGCMSHLTPAIPESMKRIFEAAGQKYWYMDESASICCGRPLYQQGFVKQAAELRRKNTQRILNSGVKTLVVSCPICYQSFTKEYNLKGVKVLHHSEYIASLIESGALKLHNDGVRVAYHDPCELGRGCGIYDEPREVISASGVLLKLSSDRSDSLCCGQNLGDTVLNWEQQCKVRDAAYSNLAAPSPDVIATACPMCKKAFVGKGGIPVKDIAEIVVEHLADESVVADSDRKQNGVGKRQIV